MPTINNETKLLLKLLTELAKAKVEEVKIEEFKNDISVGFENGARWVMEEAKRIVDDLGQETTENENI